MPIRTPERERYFDLGFAAEAPNLIDPDQGITNVVRVADASYEVDAIIMDAADQRLVRSGVVLARRSFGGGPQQWYLDAPDWAPWLPVDRAVAQTDPPREFQDAVVPFQRRAALEESAHLTCTRRTWHLRDAEWTVLARLRDDQVTVRRGRLVTSRYREVTLTPVAATPRQTVSLTESLTGVGASRTRGFPSLAERLGAPATAPSDLPPVAEWDDATPAPDFVRALWAAQLRELLGADLAVRSGMTQGTARVVTVLRRLRREVRGLAPILEPEWVADSDAALARATAQVADSGDAPSSPEYLGVIDRFVSAVRTGHPVDADHSAGDLAKALLDNAVVDLRRRGDDLSDSAPEAAWQAATTAAEALVDACAITDLLPLTRDRRFTRRAVRLAERLRDTVHDDLVAIRAGLAAATVDEAFEAGRRYEREVREQARVRREFIAEWPKRRKRMSR